MESEKIIERKLVQAVKANKGMYIKLLSDQLSGLPDRLCLFPNQKIVFVELKTTSQKPKRIQCFIHKKLKKLGFRVEIIDSTEQITKFIESI